MFPPSIHELLMWIRVGTVIASICTTAIPILYGFFPWRSSLWGKLFMLESVSFAIAMDTTTFFAFFRPKNLFIVYLIDAGFVTLIAVSTFALAVLIFIRLIGSKKDASNGVQR